MEQFLQLFRETMEYVLKETLATNAEFLQRLRELQESGDDRLGKVLRYVENATKGQKYGTIIGQNDLNQLQTIMSQSVENIIRRMNNRGATNIAKTLESGDPERINKLEDYLRLYGDQLVNASGDWLDNIERMNNAISRYNMAMQEEVQHLDQLKLSNKMIWAMNKWDVAQNQYRKDFWQDVRNYQKSNLVSEDVAISSVRQDYMSRGIATAEFINPNGQPGGAAAMASDRQKFIRQLVSAISQSSFGKKLTNLVSDSATAMTFAIASKAPPWLQKTLLASIALGIPQALGPLLVNLPMTILNLMSTRFGRVLLGNMIQAPGNAIGAVSAAQNSTAGMRLLGSNGLWASRGALTGGELAVGGASLIAGFLGGKLLLNLANFITDKTMGKDNNTGNLVKALVGAIVAGGAIALITFGTVTGIVPVCLAIGVAIAGIWQAVSYFFKWYKGRDADQQSLWDKFQNWISGNDENSNSSNDNSNTPNPTNLAPGATIKGLHGGQFIDTSKYSKSELQSILSKNKAYESIAKGGSNWWTDAGSFYNDVMFAAVGTSKILDSVFNDSEVKKVAGTGGGIITSAYGSSSSGHSKGSKSHYVGGGKLDLSLRNMKNQAQVNAYKKALMNTGYFDFVNEEFEGGHHFDVKIKESALKRVDDEAKAKKAMKVIDLESQLNKEKSKTLFKNQDKIDSLTKEYFKLKDDLSKGVY